MAHHRRNSVAVALVGTLACAVMALQLSAAESLGEGRDRELQDRQEAFQGKPAARPAARPAPVARPLVVPQPQYRVQTPPQPQFRPQVRAVPESYPRREFERRGDRDRGRGRGYAVGGAAVIIGSILAFSAFRGPDRESVYARCDRRFPDFDYDTGTFINEDGDRVLCPYLRPYLY